jgi:glycosyltransferase involved in cell wall biosynthesis
MKRVSKKELEALRNSELFDARWYLEQYPDVKMLGMDPLEHYLWIGEKLGRLPSPGQATATRQLPRTQSSTISNNVDHDYVSKVQDPADFSGCPLELIAFYLPQFHPIAENDEWWGPGFTEWTNVTKAVPQYPGHYQPHLPGELGFYDLRLVDVMRQQVELAKLYGIGGFCFHYYWFSGRRVLERPVNQFLDAKDIDFPFCFCWANENWTRRWDGLDNEILLKQEHNPETDIAFIDDIIPAMRDERYIRFQGRPVLIIYRASLLPDPVATAERWRERCIEAGVGDPYLVAARSFGITDPRPFGFDAAVEFPPHQFHAEIPGVESYSGFKGTLFSYEKMVDQSVSQPLPEYTLMKAVCPSWDNEARKPGAGHVFHGSSPALYKHWLKKVGQANLQRMAQDPKQPPFLFVNAWNEWAEGAHLEPDRKYGYAFLQATRDALLGFERAPDVVARAPQDKHASKAANAKAAKHARVSIVVPNFNHEPFLRARLESIYNQTFKDFEVILLDDASTDDSRQILEEYRAKYPDITSILVNDRNSGSPFRQWALGIERAKGDLIWIAESDDLCEADFLERVVPSFERGSVQIAYGDIQYVDDTGIQYGGLDEYRRSTGSDIWGSAYCEPAPCHFSGPFGIKNIIANVSGAVFRRPSLSQAFVDYLSGFKICGDWIFYMNVTRGGDVSYVPEAKSYFRQHRSNTSVVALKTHRYYAEHGKVARYLKDFLRADGATLAALKSAVEGTYEYVFRDEEKPFPFDAAYDESYEAAASDPNIPKRLNLLIASLGFYLGGGEIVPIHLANALYRSGHSVTFLALGWDQLDYEPGVREMLHPGIPVLTRKELTEDPDLLQKYNFDLINSHNIGVEYFFNELRRKGATLPKYVVTHHGGYEASTPARPILQEFASFVDHWMYIAEKNLVPLEQAGIDVSKATRILNGMHLETPEVPLTRASFGIGPDDFVCVLASRAIPEKGWQAAIEAVEQLNKGPAPRPVHLLLIGDGPEYQRLKAQSQSSHVTLLGYRKDAAQFYELADVGVLPSTYAGESFPLTLIESLLAGKPCIATDIGEISNMLRTDSGENAGIILPANCADDLVDQLAEAIRTLRDNSQIYDDCSRNARILATNYDMEAVAKKYEQTFRQVRSTADS